MIWLFAFIAFVILVLAEAHFGWFIGLLVWVFYELQREK